MIRYLLHWMLILSGLFTLPVLLIRAQPYDDSGLRAFLTPPEGCPMPCFMGIRPGATSVDDAHTVLIEHPWVSKSISYAQRYIEHWYWSPAAPNWLRGDKEATFSSEGGRPDPMVRTLSFYTMIPVGDLMLAYGTPDLRRTLTEDQNAFERYYWQELLYADLCMWIFSPPSLSKPRDYHWFAILIYVQPNTELGTCDANSL